MGVSAIDYGVRRNEVCFEFRTQKKVRDGETPSPTRETRALPNPKSALAPYEISLVNDL
jgi:hypothetical protein